MQYTNLEEEFDDWKLRAEEEISKKDKEIKELHEKLSKNKEEELPDREKFDSSVQFPEESDLQTIQKFLSSCPNILQQQGKFLYIGSPPVLTEGLNKFLEVENGNNTTELISSSSSTRGSRILSPCLNGCGFGNQLQSFGVCEDLCRVHREELRRLHQLKMNTDSECNNLIKQKEILMQDIIKLQSLRNATTTICSCAKIEQQGEQACRIDINVLQALNTRLQAQEQKCRNLQITLKQQQQYTDRILHRKEIKLIR